MPEHTHILLATLGGQPQVVTFTLDLLLRDGFPISEVFVILPKASDQRLQHSLACLRKQFIDDCYHIDGRTITCRFDSRVLRLNNIPLEDILDDVGAVGAHETIYHLIRELKQQRQCIVHLSVTGGRRTMALLAISAAQLNFKHTDHIWHIYTPREFRLRADEGAIMHASPDDGVRLFTVPFVPWGIKLLFIRNVVRYGMCPPASRLHITTSRKSLPGTSIVLSILLRDKKYIGGSSIFLG